MAFSGYEVIFDGVPGIKYDLLLYDIGSNKQSDNINFTSAGKLIEDRLSRSPTSLLYGVEDNGPLSFQIVLAASPDRIERNIPYDRFEIEAISSWLTGHRRWKTLKIVQPDLSHVRYQCLITDFKQILYEHLPWAFSCTVTCDSPYAYYSTQEFEYVCGVGQTDILLRNRSSYNGIYYPMVEIMLQNSKSVEIVNRSNKNASFKFENLPSAVHKIVVDNKSKVITNDADLNIYSCFNFGYIGLVRGDNDLRITGPCTVKFICDFPINVGG